MILSSDLESEDKLTTRDCLFHTRHNKEIILLSNSEKLQQKKEKAYREVFIHSVNSKFSKVRNCLHVTGKLAQ
jgi:hypothetical protein